MTPETVITLGQRAMELAILVSAPLLLAALVVGVLISLFQAATQINEMTLSFVPKLLVLVAGVVVGRAVDAGAAGRFHPRFVQGYPQPDRLKAMHISSAEIAAWVGSFLWPLTRVAALVSVAPVLGSRILPRRVRLMLALALTWAIVPLAAADAGD
jgi:flagellar biosynthetic protein FliQ